MKFSRSTSINCKDLQRIAIASSQLQQQQILLTPEQHHYLANVLRLREGGYFIAMDGRGKWWLAQLVGKQAQILELLEVSTELPVSVTLMVALPKGQGFDEIVRVCTEVGASIIAPILSERTLLNPSSQKLERWRRIAQEAAEQSERSFVPSILEPISFQQALFSVVDQPGYICVARGDYPHLQNCLRGKPQHSKIVIATGPEGGWTPTEVESAINNGLQPVSLGHRILRAVTAPIVAMSLAAAGFEEQTAAP